MSTTISGALISQPTQLNLIPKEGPKSIAITLPFTGTVISFAVDFSQVIQQGKIACINGLFIDNSAGGAAVTVVVQGSGQTIVCPPQSQGIFPVIGPELTRLCFTSTSAVTAYVQALNTTPTLSVWSVLGGNGGVAVTSGQGVAVNNGTVSTVGQLSLTGVASGTLTINPGNGISDAVVTMPSGGGTVTLAAAPVFANQRAMLTVKQGSTPGSITLNGGFVFGATGGPTSYTATNTAGAVDRLQLISPDGTHWAVMAINQGFTI